MLLLDDILQRINLLIQLAFNIKPFIILAHSVKSVVFLRGSLYQSPSSWISAALHAAGSPTAVDSIYMIFVHFMIIHNRGMIKKGLGI